MDSLSTDEVRRVHDASLELLAETGMAVEHERAREILVDAGGTVDGEVVTVPPEVVEDAVERAPESFVWRARNPEKDVTVGDGEPVISPARGPRYVKRYGEQRHRATMDDFELLARLAHEEGTVSAVGYDLCSPEGYSLPGNPGGFDHAKVGYELLEGLFTATDKPIVGSARRGPEAEASLDTAAIAFEDPDLSEHYVLGILHTRSPRLFNEPMVSGLLAFARAGQPLSISSGAIAGASGPRSLTETFVLANAEALFGLTLAQLANPGTPVVYGFASTAYDRANEAVSYGSPTGAVLSHVSTAMSEFYELPVRGDGAITDAMALDDQSGSESMLHAMGAVQTDADLLLNAVGVLDTHAVVSPEKFVLDAERIRAAQTVEVEFEAIRDALAEGEVSLDTLSGTQPGVPFYDERDPAELRDAPVSEPTIAIRTRHDDWVESGSETIGERASQRIQTLLDRYERPPMAASIETELSEYVAEHAE